MRPFIGKFLYTFLIWLILIFVQDYLDIETSWWTNLIIVIIGWFFGAFIYTQFHGIQVGDLKHFPSSGTDHAFQMIVKISGRGHYVILGNYIRVEVYSDLVLQSKLFTALNKLPGSKWIRESVDNNVEQPFFVPVDDPTSIFKETPINIVKSEKIK